MSCSWLYLKEDFGSVSFEKAIRKFLKKKFLNARTFLWVACKPLYFSGQSNYKAGFFFSNCFSFKKGGGKVCACGSFKRQWWWPHKERGFK